MKKIKLDGNDEAKMEKSFAWYRFDTEQVEYFNYFQHVYLFRHGIADKVCFIGSKDEVTDELVKTKLEEHETFLKELNEVKNENI